MEMQFDTELYITTFWFVFVDNSVKDQVVDGWVVSSESCSFNSIGAKYYREVLPGNFSYQYSWGHVVL